MTDLEKAKQLVSEITNLGYETLIVGGAVRDIILGQIPHDIDIATNCPMKKLAELYKCHDIGQSFKFGITTVTYQDSQFEIANFREDCGSADNRHPDSVKIVKDFYTDAFRRDFTINALGMTADGKIVDHVNGQKDISNKIIRFVGFANDRIKEDSLRMLRALRFAAKLNFKLDSDTFNAIRENAFLIQNVSAERIKQELFKTAGYGGPELATFIELAEQTGILSYILPEIASTVNDEHQPKHHPEGAAACITKCLNATMPIEPAYTGYISNLIEIEQKYPTIVFQIAENKSNFNFSNNEGFWNYNLIRKGTVFDHLISSLIHAPLSTDPMMNLSVLFHDIGKHFTKRYMDDRGYHIYYNHDQHGATVMQHVGNRLKMSSKEIEILSFVCQYHMSFYDMPDMKASKAAKMIESPHFEYLVYACKGDSYATKRQSDVDRLNEILDKLPVIKDKIFMKQKQNEEANSVSPLRKLVSGELVMQITGLKPSKEVGRIIQETVDWAMDEGIDSTDKIVAHIKEIKIGA